MCCPNRNWPKNIIFLMSIGGVICAIVMIVMAFLLVDSEVLKQLEEDPSLSDIEDGKQLVFIALLIFALVTLFVSACGMVIKCCDKPCLTCTYGIVLLPTWIIVIAFGGIAVYLVQASKDEIQDQCNDLADDLSVDVSSEGYTVSISLNIYEDIFINQEMCSDNCPCPANDKMSDWIDLTTEQLATYERTKSFIFIDNNPANNIVVNTFSTFQECIEGIQQPDPLTAPLSDLEFYGFAQSFREQDDFEQIEDWIKFFEEEYSCAGVCNPALFAWQASVTLGIPQDSCINAIKDDLTDAFTGLAIAALLSGIFLFITFLCQYCLWCKKDDD